MKERANGCYEADTEHEHEHEYHSELFFMAFCFTLLLLFDEVYIMISLRI